MSRRCAIYARFSTDLQNERSVDDQIALCRDYAAREGLAVTACYSDAARSGASIIGRDGLLSLIAESAAEPLPFEIVLVEHADRLSRDMEDLAGLHKRLLFRGIEIRAVNSGTMDSAMIGLFGLVGQMQREEGAKKVRRGMMGVVRGGRSAGGRLYGYRPVPGAPGELEIVEAEAAIVRRIFAEYLAGSTPREIAARLNRDRIAPPRGARWNSSTINGNAKRGNGLLQNELFAGRRVWNKVSMIRNPATGKRVSRPNPPAEWMHAEAPALAVVTPDIFAAAAARKRARGSVHASHARTPRHLLSGLLRCRCGAGLASKGKDQTGQVRVECSAAKEAGTCPGSMFYLPRIEAAVVGALQAELLHPKVIAAFVRSYQEERTRLAAGRVKNRARIEGRIAELSREQSRLIDLMVAADGAVPELLARSKAVAIEQEAARAELAAAPPEPNIVALHPASLARYELMIARLQACMAAGLGAGDGEGAKALRELVESVTVTPGDTVGTVRVAIFGRLNRLLEIHRPIVGGKGGSGGGTRTPDPRIMIPVL
ncbi:recombinase [Terrihabitans soli]|uniref:Recombinase n=1 Tax=Terrihabitans soli TaxID=708113 RepID=A0A6S6QPY1_9HYPH|nr:recombinase [Terrihabitans soli]